MYPKARFTGFPPILFAVFGCVTDSGLNDAPGPDPGPGDPNAPDVVASKKSRVRFKGGARWATDLAIALDVPRDALCAEMGRYDCVAEAHRIVLGGVEPYRLGIREPTPGIPVSAPIAVDRVALMACQRSVDAQMPMGSEGSIFGPALETPESADARRRVIDRLYDRIVMRGATDSERAVLTHLFETIDSANRIRDWAILSCFAVATTAEALFY